MQKSHNKSEELFHANKSQELPFYSSNTSHDLNNTKDVEVGNCQCYCDTYNPYGDCGSSPRLIGTEPSVAQCIYDCRYLGDTFCYCK